ncbi:MAG: hypothetical protein KatS3mg115_0268 [Candidatus Poribacteria bacterium]|nr:MAG: hypothetical protein KatS3mg115_0268 [Candidatus Poribacteria bacterium]
MDAGDASRLILSRTPLEPGEVVELLKPYGFLDPLRVDRELQALADLCPSRERFARLFVPLLEAASRSPDPDAAIHRFHSYVAARGESSILLEELERIEGLLEDLLFLLGGSEYLSAVLVRNPHYLEWLLETNARDTAKNREQMESELRDWVRRFRTPESREGVLRQFKRRESFRIGMRDLLGVADVEETLRETTALADAALQVACELVQEQMEAKHGRPQTEDGTPVSYVVIGMGKLGGEELNYSSDIDILFLYEEEGRTAQGLDNQTYFVRFTEELVRLLSQHHEEGYVFRVDLRLRPQGETGALARSLDSYLGYYETWGELFDRQALIKARPCAGDLELGRRFLRAVEPFVYRSIGSEEDIQTVLEEIFYSKLQGERRVARQGSPQLHLKWGPGGIRDVEFVVQALQLLHGGTVPEVRVRPTLEAIHALAQRGYLSSSDAEALRRGYRFLRRAENMVQLVADRQEYALPDDPTEWRRFALRLGYHDRPGNPAEEQFRSELQAHQRAVREVFQRVFAFEPDPFRDRMDEILQDSSEITPEAEAFLRGIGIEEVPTAVRWLRELARGSARVRFTPRIRRQFLKFCSSSVGGAAFGS